LGIWIYDSPAGRNSTATPKAVGDVPERWRNGSNAKTYIPVKNPQSGPVGSNADRSYGGFVPVYSGDVPPPHASGPSAPVQSYTPPMQPYIPAPPVRSYVPPAGNAPAQAYIPPPPAVPAPTPSPVGTDSAGRSNPYGGISGPYYRTR